MARVQSLISRQVRLEAEADWRLSEELVRRRSHRVLAWSESHAFLRETPCSRINLELSVHVS